MSNKTVTLPEITTHKIFKQIIDAKAIAVKENKNYIADMIFSALDESTIQHIITLMLMDNEYKVLSIGDYVRLNPISYHEGQEYESDVLKDMGLIHSSGKVYGRIKDDASWSSGYNPFYARLKVELLYHNEDKKLKLVEKDINPLELEYVSKGHIAYFKNKKKTKEKEICLDSPENL